MAIWPKQDYKSMCAFYGPPGEQTTKLMLPYPMRIAWDTATTVKSIQCHPKVAESLYKILDEIYAHEGRNLKRIQALGLDLFGGCLAVRKMRGGTSWSTHSWGAAIDLNPMANQLQVGREHAAMPEWVIDIFIKYGWVSMGRSKNRDFMHFQAANF